MLENKSLALHAQQNKHTEMGGGGGGGAERDRKNVGKEKNQKEENATG